MSSLKVSSISHRSGSGNITIPAGNRLVGAEAGSIAAPGMVIGQSYVRSDARSAYSIPTAGNVGSFITDLNITITPKFATSLILINYCIGFECVNDTIFRLFRNDVEVGRNVNDPNYWSGIWHPGYDADNASTPRTNQCFYLDNPGTTAALTYKLMIQSAGTGATTFYLNRAMNAVGQANYEVGISQVLCQEIAQ